MPYRSAALGKGQYYHVYNRGAGRGRIFFGDDNYAHCLHLVKHYSRRYGATVIAYCLMPNHYHFCLRQETDLPLSRFMGVLFNSYVQAVNRQRGRTGTLFEGRFRHARIDREEYLVHLCRYIHLNPVKANLASEPGEWAYSNYLEWIGKRAGTLKDHELISAHFPTPEAYEQFVADVQHEERSRPHIEAYVWD